MAQMTLLEVVQDILNDIDGDEVNSINDTIEAQQIAQVVKTTYFNIMENGRDWPHLDEMFQLEAATVAKPVYMKLPDTIREVRWVKYNKRSSTDTHDKMENVKYKTPEEFMQLVDARLSDATNVDVITDASGVSMNILNDTPPTYYTCFDNTYLVFDSFDSAIDTTNLVSSKTQCFGKRAPTFTTSDTAVADIPGNMFQYLLAEAKATCFINFKQSQNPKAEQVSLTHKRRMSQDAWRVKKGITYPNYGRNK
jgi:hypothetical protein